MARINIEEKWWTDPRRKLLTKECNGDEEKADGIAIALWRLAQNYLEDGKAIIPENVIESLEAKSKLIQANMMQKEAKGYYVAGSAEFLSWLEKRRKNGQKGGSVKNPKKLENLRNSRSKLEANESKLEASYSYSYSSSSSSSNENKNNIAQNSVSSVSDFSKIEIQKGIEAVYQRYPKKLGKAKGMAKLQRTIKTESDLRALECAITRFISFHDKNLTEKQFVPYWSTWANSWKDWLDPETGSSEDFSKKSSDDYERAFEKIRLAEEQRQQKENEQDVSR